MKNETNNILSKRDFSELLAEIAYTFNAINSDLFDIIMENVLSILGLHLNISRVYIYENNGKSNDSRCAYQWNNTGIDPIYKDDASLQELRYQQWDNYILEKGQIICNNINTFFTGIFLELLKEQNLKSLLAFPLYVKGKYHGFIGFDECTNYIEWNETEVASLRAISHLIADAYARKMNEEQLKFNEEKYRSLFENAKDAIIILDKFEILEFNTATTELLDYSAEEIIYQSLLYFSPEYQSNEVKSQDLALKYAKEALQGKKQFFPWLLIRGGKNTFESEISLSRFSKGKKFFLLAIIRDVSTSKEHEQKIKAQMLELEEVNKTKDRFFSIIAHDLRNPFNSLLGITENLIENFNDFEPEEIKEYLTLLLQSSQQGYNLLENLLNWSRSQTGKLKINAKVLNVSELIDTSIELMLNNAASKNLEIINNVSFDILAFADENMITTVLRNLLSNAIKFTPYNGSIRFEATKHKKMIEVCIADNGVGMTEETMNNLFKIDVFTSTLGTNKEPGTGLGIILCKEFIEKNNGKIWVESSLNNGTIFYFSVPRA